MYQNTIHEERQVSKSSLLDTGNDVFNFLYNIKPIKYIYVV